jgi:hypothetical protein
MMEKIEQLNKKVSNENIKELEKQIKNIKENIYKFYTEMRFLDEKDITSKNKYEETIKKYEEELVILEKTIKQMAKVGDSNYLIPEEETIGTYKVDGKPIIPMEEKLKYIVSKINKELGYDSISNEKEKKEFTEDILTKLTEEINQEMQHDKVNNINTSTFEKFDSLIKEIDENEKSFKIHFPELNINNKKEISFLNEEYRETYNYLKNRHEKLRGKLFSIKKELENKISNNKNITSSEIKQKAKEIAWEKIVKKETDEKIEGILNKFNEAKSEMYATEEKMKEAVGIEEYKKYEKELMKTRINLLNIDNVLHRIYKEKGRVYESDEIIIKIKSLMEAQKNDSEEDRLTSQN